MIKELEKFLFTIEVGEGKSANTIKSYKKDIEQFIEYLGNNEEIENFSEVKVLTIRSFMSYLSRELNLSKRTINRKISAIRTLFDFMIEKKIVENNVLKFIHIPKYQNKIPEYITENELRKIESVIDKEKITGIRDLAIVNTLFSSGLRSFELINLQPFMINFEQREIRVIGKGGKERITFFNQNSEYWLRKYLDMKIQKKQQDDYIFLNKNGTQLTTRSLRRNISRYVKDAQIEKEVSPHTFRHSFATFLINNGVEIIYVQELLGHASIATTQIYTHISPKALRKVYLESHPMAKEL